MLIFFLKGVLLGLSASVTPGPFLAFLLSSTLTWSWRPTLPAAFAPLISDGPIILIVMVVLTQTPDWFLNIIQILGGFFLLYLAKEAWESRNQTIKLTAVSAQNTPQMILKGAMMNALSPGPYIFWSILAGPIVLEGWRDSPILGVSFVMGFYITLIGGFMGFILLFAIASQIDPRVNQLLRSFSAVALLLFSLYQLWTGIIPLLG